MIKNLNENYHVTSVEDILDGYVDNVDDNQIDSDIKMWKKFSNLLGVGKWYTHLSVLVDGDGEYDPSYYNAVLIQSKNSWRLYDLDGIKIISEYRNGINFLYFKNTDDADEYITKINNINSEDITEDLQLTEDVNYNDMIQYEVYFELYDDYDISDIDMNIVDLEEIAGSLDYVKVDAINNFFDKVQSTLVDNGVEIKHMCGIDDFTIEIDDINVDIPAIYATFYASNECDIKKLTDFLEKYSEDCEGSATEDIQYRYYTGGTVHSPYYPDPGIPEEDEAEVSFTYGVTLNKLNISEVN